MSTSIIVVNQILHCICYPAFHDETKSAEDSFAAGLSSRGLQNYPQHRKQGFGEFDGNEPPVCPFPLSQLECKPEEWVVESQH